MVTCRPFMFPWYYTSLVIGKDILGKGLSWKHTTAYSQIHVCFSENQTVLFEQLTTVWHLHFNASVKQQNVHMFTYLKHVDICFEKCLP